MKHLALFCSAAALAAGLATAASAATVYTGNRIIGTGSAQLSITTDDTIGVLTTANILDWTIGLNEDGANFTLYGPASGNNSQLLISGTALRATATEILFDFDAEGNQFALFQAPFIGSSSTYYCIQTNGCSDFDGPSEAVEANAN